MMKLSRRFCSPHVPQLSFFLLSTKDLGGRGKSHNLFNASPSTASLINEIPPPEQQIPQLVVQCKSINYNCQSHNCKSLRAPQLSFFFYQPNLGVRGRSEEKGFHAVNSKQKLTKKLFIVYSFLTC
jgi:hypothetical protein